MTETTRGSGHYPVRQSIVAKRNATEDDLARAQQQYAGQLVNPTPRHEDQCPPAYRCAAVRLDSTRRIILDLVRADRYQQEVFDAH
jgi:hypothetical protein